MIPSIIAGVLSNLDSSALDRKLRSRWSSSIDLLSAALSSGARKASAITRWMFVSRIHESSSSSSNEPFASIGSSGTRYGATAGVSLLSQSFVFAFTGAFF
eukprot:scaffold1315_cov124-Isochrysis_galbana.AAC.2